MSSVTFLIVWCVFLRSAAALVLPVDAAATAAFAPCLYTMPQILFRNLYAPSTPLSDHSRSRSGGAANREKSLIVSAPYRLISASGSMTFFLDFDIFSTLPTSTGFSQREHLLSFTSSAKSHPCLGHFSVSLQTIPWVSKLAKGSLTPTMPRSLMQRVKKREYRR